MADKYKKILGMVEVCGEQLKLAPDSKEREQNGYPEVMWFGCSAIVKKHLPIWQEHFGRKVELLIDQLLPDQQPAGTVIGLGLPKS